MSRLGTPSPSAVGSTLRRMLRRVTHALNRSGTADQLRGLALRVVGIAAAVQAGFSISSAAGWGTLALGAFVLEWSLEDDEDQAEPYQGRA